MIVDIDDDMCTHADNVAPLRMRGGSHIDVLIDCNSIVFNNTLLSHRDTERSTCLNDNNNMGIHTDNTALLRLMIVPHIDHELIIPLRNYDTDGILSSLDHTHNSDVAICHNDYVCHDTEVG